MLKKWFLVVLAFSAVAASTDMRRAKYQLRLFGGLFTECKQKQVKYYLPEIYNKIDTYYKYAEMSFKSGRYKTSIGYSLKGKELSHTALELTAKKAKTAFPVKVVAPANEVKVRIAYTNKTVEAYNNMKLTEKDNIYTGPKGHGYILLSTFSTVFLSPNTKIKLRKLKEDKRDFSKFVSLQFFFGEVRVKTQNINFEASRYMIYTDKFRCRIASGDFIIKKEKDNVYFINLNGKLYVSNQTDTFVVDSGFGVKMKEGVISKKTVKIDSAPFPKYPREITLKTRRTIIKTEYNKRFTQYKIQFSHTPDFKNIVREYVKKSNKMEVYDLKNGVYFWRVRGYYASGLFTPFSKPARFNIKQDTVPPKLEVYTPHDGEAISREYVYVSGRTEPLTKVKINQFEVVSDTYGDFDKGLIFREGLHTVKVSALDKNNNKTEIVKIISVDYSPPSLVIPEKIPEFTNNKILTITGATDEGVTVTLNGDPVSTEQGKFSINYILKEGGNKLVLNAYDKAKNYTSKTYYVILDSRAPELSVLSPNVNTDTLPVFARKVITIKGKIEPYVRLIVNNDSMWAGKKPEFSYKYFAREGINIVHVVAVDSAANSTEKYVPFLVSTDSKKLVISDSFVIFGTTKFPVFGFTEPGNVVFFNKKPFYADNKGIFKGMIDLTDGIVGLNIVVSKK